MTSRRAKTLPPTGTYLIACTLTAGLLLGTVPSTHAQSEANRTASPAVQRRLPNTDSVGRLEPLPSPVTLAPNVTEPLSLLELVAIAEQNSPALAQAAAEIEKARGHTRQAALYPNPVVQGGGMQLGGSESQYYAQLSQEIVTSHKRQISRSAASQQITQAELLFLRARFELLTQVRKGYAAIVAADRRAVVLTKLVELARKSQETADRLFQAGEGARPDSLLMEIELEKAEVALENAHVVAAGARRQLAAVMGVRDLQIHQLEGGITPSFQHLADLIVVDGYVPQNADVLYAEAEVERTRLVAQRAEVEPIPNVTVTAGYMHQLQGIENMAILNLSVPIPAWNRNQGNIRAAQADIARAMDGVRQSQNEVARQMADAITRFRASDEQVLRFEQRIMPKASEGVRIIQQGFENGEFDFQRLLQAQRSLVEANLGYINALVERWNAAAELAGLAQVEVFP